MSVLKYKQVFIGLNKKCCSHKTVYFHLTVLKGFPLIAAEQTLQRTRKAVSLTLVALLAAELGVRRLVDYKRSIKIKMINEVKEGIEIRCECEAREGELHNWYCRKEHCPFCNLRFGLGCDCVYVLLGLQSRNNSPETNHLTEDICNEGLSNEQQEGWFRLCTQRGRIPFIDAPQMCGRCGCLCPKFFMVQDSVWFYYTNPDLKDKIICFDCFQHIRQCVDKYNARPSWLPSDKDIDRFITAWNNRDKSTLVALEPKKWSTYQP